MTKATLAEIIARKQQGKIDKLQVRYYHSETLGLDIEVRKIPLKKYIEIMESVDDETSIEGMNNIIFNMCPMFKTNTKEAMELYGVQIPTELPAAVLEEQLNEMGDICSIANSFYGLDKLEDVVKNSSSKGIST